jgi:lipid II isoglutaminyl synthase (glutamine-hydrolysing)
MAVTARELDHVVVVIGTNGKTTTARLISDALTGTGHDVVANRSGANMPQGVLSTLLAAASPVARRFPARGEGHGRIGVLEVDELALERVLPALPAPLIVVTNLFRDQLDRYGEPDAIVDRWLTALRQAPPGTRFVYCADDPRLAHIARSIRLPNRSFGMDGASHEAASMAVIADESAVTDPVACRVCGQPLRFSWQSVGHLGAFACPAGHLNRADPDVVFRFERGRPGTDSSISFSGPGMESISVRLPLPGLPSAYDAAATMAAMTWLGLAPAHTARALAAASAAFGRLEEIPVGGRRLLLGLVKNAVSLAEMASLARSLEPNAVVLGLSDAPADGRDVSWVWDADLGSLVGSRLVALTGSRASDLRLRLKYGNTVERSARIVASDPGLERTIDRALLAVPQGGLVLVAATYTAILGVRDILRRRGLVDPIPR